MNQKKEQVSFKVLGIEFSGPLWLGIVVLIIGLGVVGINYFHSDQPTPDPHIGPVIDDTTASGTETSPSKDETSGTETSPSIDEPNGNVEEEAKCDFMKNIECDIN